MRLTSSRIVLMIIAGGLLVWGGLFALGAFLNDETGAGLLKAAIVLGCVLAFLGFWGLMFLLHGQPKNRFAAPDDNDVPDHDEQPPAAKGKE